jgi:hypothetical protein
VEGKIKGGKWRDRRGKKEQKKSPQEPLNDRHNFRNGWNNKSGMSAEYI